MTRSAQIWYEQFNDDGTATRYNNPTNYVNSQLGHRGTTLNVDGIWVARESTDDWAISAVGAGALRAKLTPLTLSIPNIDGMKVDFQSANYTMSMVNTNLSQSVGQWGAPDTPMIRGFQFRRKFGALTLGSTVSNLYATQPNRDRGTSLKGSVSDYAPTPLIYAIRVVDDSPNDSGGPIVHDVKLKVNGRYRPDIKPIVILDDLRRERITAVTDRAQQRYLEPRSVIHVPLSFDSVTINERMPKYLDYLNMNDYYRGWNTKKLNDTFDLQAAKQYYRIIDPGKKPLRVNGTEYVVYLFDTGSITDRITRVAADITVENDYRIQTAQIFTKKKEGGHDSTGENYSHYDTQYWRTMAQADGNIKDGSNLRTVSIDFGYEVANLIYGFDAHFNYLGFKINGEFVTNTHYYMFSDGVPGTGLPSNVPQDISARKGHRSSQTDHAYYLIVEKDWDHFGFAGELFKMGKFYRPYLDYFMASEIAGDKINVRNNNLRFTMIEDNDDDDMYPDTMYITRVMAISMQSLRDPDGVFPGNDVDHDGLADNEKNNNNIPDYNEPFFMFDVDPDEFVFGDDFNNNSIPDFREDDMKYDTPYDLDRRGRHFYLRFTPQRNVNVYLGSFRTRGVGLDTRTDDDYLKFNVRYNVFTVGRIFAEYRHERIQDNIQDRFVVVPTRIVYSAGATWRNTSYSRDLYYDEIEYRNSRVNRFYLDSTIRPVPSLSIMNHVKYERNRQVEGSMYDNTFQPKDTITTFAMVNRFVYTKAFGNWTFSPGLKFRLYKKGRSESLNPLDHYLMRIPMVTLKYAFSPATNVTLGMQGFRGMDLLYKDYIQSHNSYRQINYTVQVENRTTYFGFEVWGGFGFRLEEVSFDEPYRAFEEYKSTSFFTQLWLGY